jgi:hypothetical protein
LQFLALVALINLDFNVIVLQPLRQAQTACSRSNDAHLGRRRAYDSLVVERLTRKGLGRASGENHGALRIVPGNRGQTAFFTITKPVFGRAVAKGVSRRQLAIAACHGGGEHREQEEQGRYH